MVLRTIFQHSSNVFKNLYTKENKVKQRKRYQALYLLSKRYDVCSTSDIVGISRRMINKWVGLYKKDGLGGLQIKKYKGAVKKIDSDIRKEIVKLIQTPPRKIGLSFSGWNTRTLKIWLNEVHHIDLTKPRIFQILKEEKFSWKKGEHKYILADENEQKKFLRKARKIFRNLKPNQIALFEDECSVRQHPSLTHMWMKTGTVIEIPTLGNHKKKESLAP